MKTIPFDNSNKKNKTLRDNLNQRDARLVC